jgi:hypothetical protein
VTQPRRAAPRDDPTAVPGERDGGAALEQKAKDFIDALKASVKVRRYAQAYLEHLTHGGPEPREFKVGQGQPSFSYLRMKIDRILNGDDR